MVYNVSNFFWPCEISVPDSYFCSVLHSIKAGALAEDVLHGLVVSCEIVAFYSVGCFLAAAYNE